MCCSVAVDGCPIGHSETELSNKMPTRVEWKDERTPFFEILGDGQGV